MPPAYKTVKLRKETYDELESTLNLLSGEGLKTLPKEVLTDESFLLDRGKIILLGMRALRYLVGQNGK